MKEEMLTVGKRIVVGRGLWEPAAKPHSSAATPPCSCGISSQHSWSGWLMPGWAVRSLFSKTLGLCILVNLPAPWETGGDSTNSCLGFSFLESWQFPLTASIGRFKGQNTFFFFLRKSLSNHWIAAELTEQKLQWPYIPRNTLWKKGWKITNQMVATSSKQNSAISEEQENWISRVTA